MLVFLHISIIYPCILACFGVFQTLGGGNGAGCRGWFTEVASPASSFVRHLQSHADGCSQRRILRNSQYWLNAVSDMNIVIMSPKCNHVKSLKNCGSKTLAARSRSCFPLTSVYYSHRLESPEADCDRNDTFSPHT